MGLKSVIKLGFNKSKAIFISSLFIIKKIFKKCCSRTKNEELEIECLNIITPN